MAVTLGSRYMVDDLVRAGVAGDVRRDALAGDFDAWSGGDPHLLAGRAPAWISDAAAVGAYAIKPPPATRPAPAPPPAPPRYLDGRPTDLQLEVLAALRRLLDRGLVVTSQELAREARHPVASFPDVLRGLSDRGLVDVTTTDRATLVMPGTRAAAYPEREVKRTQRTKDIEALIRAGKTIEEVIGTPLVVDGERAPSATRAEFYRVRALYCADLPKPATARPTGDKHAAVVAAYKSGTTSPTAIAKLVGGISRPRVGQILGNARRLREIE